MNLKLLFLAALACALVVTYTALRPLTLARVDEQLGPDPRVTVEGHWRLTDDGAILRAAGRTPLREPALREEDFELRFTGWYLIPRLLGRDVAL
jgi:hypothetical protein